MTRNNETRPLIERQSSVSKPNFLAKAFAHLPQDVRNTGVGVNRRKQVPFLFIPPSTKSPLFIYNNQDDQRSFLSLCSGSHLDHESEASDNESVSTFRSLPSTLESGTDADEISRLIEDHRRFSESSEIASYHSSDDILVQAERRFQDHGRRMSKSSILTGSQFGIDEEEDFFTARATVKSEAKKLWRFSLPLIVTFLLEQVFAVVSVLVVGRLGKRELAAVSLASMTSTITLAIFEGIATSLDTLCPQAYGGGHYHAVGLHLQRCCVYSLVLLLPCWLFWWNSGLVFELLINDPEVVHLTQLFLRVMIIGSPAYVLFENGKRFLQAQGLFDAATFILFISAPINVALSWFLVWNSRFGLGYVGAPIATSINFWIMFFLLLNYVIFIDGKKCWGGMSRKAFHHWYDLSKLAIPGIIMLEAESLAYEILTLFASYLGTTALASQSAISTIASLTYMVPFAVGIASSTRIANFIGAGNINSAKTATKVGLSASLVVGFFNCCVLTFGRYKIASLFSDDQDVVSVTAAVFPLVGGIQVFDALSSVASSILRAQGKQKVGGIINLVVYYIIAIPLSLCLSYVLGLNIYGLWIGVGSGMLLIGSTESVYLLNVDWEEIVEKSKLRHSNF